MIELAPAFSYSANDNGDGKAQCRAHRRSLNY